MTTATQPTLAEAPAETSTKPVKVFKDRHLSVSVFRNKALVHDRERFFHNTYLQRSYKDDAGKYQTTYSLGKDDLPAANLLLAQAWEFIVNEEASLRKKAVE